MKTLKRKINTTESNTKIICKKISFAVLLSLTLCAGTTNALEPFNPTVYFGVGTGLGFVDWGGLVAKLPKHPPSGIPDTKIYWTNPIQAGGNGLTLHSDIGVNIFKYLKIQADYFHFPETTVKFDKDQAEYIDVFYPELKKYNYQFKTHTQAADVAILFTSPLFHTKFTATAGVGAGMVFRNDILADENRISGNFTVEIGRRIARHYSSSLTFNYFTGYGESTATPAKSFMPFLYDINLNINYLFSPSGGSA